MIYFGIRLHCRVENTSFSLITKIFSKQNSPAIIDQPSCRILSFWILGPEITFVSLASLNFVLWSYLLFITVLLEFEIHQKLFKIVFSSNFCSAMFSNRRNCSRHQNKFNLEEIGLPLYNCFLCALNSQKISKLEQHIRFCHYKFTNCFMGVANVLHGIQGCDSVCLQHTIFLHTLPVLGP